MTYAVCTELLDEDMLRLVLKMSNKSYDSLHTDCKVEDNSFVILANTIKERTGNDFQKKFLKSFGLLPDDQRLTKFGGWLRSTSLDELPELLDIIRNV